MIIEEFKGIVKWITIIEKLYSGKVSIDIELLGYTEFFGFNIKVKCKGKDYVDILKFSMTELNMMTEKQFETYLNQRYYLFASELNIQIKKINQEGKNEKV